MAAQEADRVVVQLIADVDRFDAKVKQSATTFDASMNKIAASATKAETAASGIGGATGKTAGDVKRHSEAMKRDFVDLGNVMAGPTSPFVMPVKQQPAVSNAMRLVSTGAGVLGGIMGGVLVGGVFAAAAALLEFITRGDEAADKIKDLVEKLKENAEKARNAATAQEIYDRSVEGSIAKVDELTKALREQNLTLEDTINLQKAAAATALGNVVTNIGTVSTQLGQAMSALQNARSELSLAEGGVLGGTPSEIAASVKTAEARVRAAEQEVRSLSATLDALNLAANRGAVALEAVNFPLVEQRAKEAVDPIKRINREYDEMAKKARAAGTYNQQLADSIERMREADLKAARDAEKTAKAKAPSLAPVTGAEIARALGTTITSGFRTPAQNKAAKGVANSYHLTGQAIDIPLTVNGKPLTKEGIRAALAPLGVEIKELLGPGDKGHSDHFHIAFGKKRLGPDQIASAQGRAAERAAREAARAAEAAIREQNRFEEAKSRLDDALLQAQASLITGIEAQAHAAEQRVIADEQRLDAALQNDVEEGKLTQAHADELKIINARIAAEKLKLIEREKQLRLLQEESRDAEQSAQFRLDALEFQEEMARSEAERRRIGHDLLDAMYTEKRLALERQQLMAQANGDLREANRLQQQINELPRQHQRDAARLDRATMGPFETFLDRIPQDAEEANEALESMAVNGIQSAVDGLAELGASWIKIGGIGGKVINQLIADLIRLVLYQQLLAPLANLLGGGAAAAGGSGISVTGFGNPQFFPSAKGNAFGGGEIVPFASGGIVNRPTIFPMAGGAGLMGEAGPEAIMPLGRDSQGRLGIRIANDRAASPWGGGQAMVIVGVQANDFFEGKILQVTGPVIAESSSRATHGGAALARDSLARKALHRLDR